MLPFGVVLFIRIASQNRRDPGLSVRDHAFFTGCMRDRYRQDTFVSDDSGGVGSNFRFLLSIVLHAS